MKIVLGVGNQTETEYSQKLFTTIMPKEGADKYIMHTSKTRR